MRKITDKGLFLSEKIEQVNKYLDFLEDKIIAWHDADTTQSLRDYLNLTLKQYVFNVEEPCNFAVNMIETYLTNIQDYLISRIIVEDCLEEDLFKELGFDIKQYQEFCNYPYRFAVDQLIKNNSELTIKKKEQNKMANKVTATTTVSSFEELMEKLTAAVSFKYKESHPAPSVLTSKLPNGKFYASVVKYSSHTDKDVMHKSTRDTLRECVEDLAEQLLATTVVKRNPMDELSDFVRKS